jgi:hypothetical protein
MSLSYQPLGVMEDCLERPFTHPRQSLADLEYLRQIAGGLRRYLDLPGRPAGQRPEVARLAEADGRRLRVVVCGEAALRGVGELGVVGFFGQRRTDAPAGLLDRLDEELLEEFLQHPYILAYCSRELPDGNWGNLVLMGAAEAGQHWRGSERHRRAAEDLAPHYYATVRIHNAQLLGGLLAGGDLVLLRTKYYDYSGTSQWRGVREQTPPRRFPFA